jgi:hypothetical protein
MSQKKKNALWITFLAIAFGLIIWHAVTWHFNGKYLDLFNCLNTGRCYIAVLYNLGLMLGVGFLLGFLIEKIMSLISGPQDEGRR